MCLAVGPGRTKPTVPWRWGPGDLRWKSKRHCFLVPEKRVGDSTLRSVGLGPGINLENESRVSTCFARVPRKFLLWNLDSGEMPPS